MLIHTQYGHMMSLHEKHVNKSLSWYSSPQSKSKSRKQTQDRQSSVASPDRTPPWMRILTTVSLEEGKPQIEPAPRSSMQSMNHSKYVCPNSKLVNKDKGINRSIMNTQSVKKDMWGSLQCRTYTKPSTYSKQGTRTQRKHAGHLGQRESQKGWKWEESQLFQGHNAWVLAEGFSGRARSDGAGMSRQDPHFAVYHHLLGPGTKVSGNLCPGLRLSPSMSWEQWQVSHHCLLLRN